MFKCYIACWQVLQNDAIVNKDSTLGVFPKIRQKLTQSFDVVEIFAVLTANMKLGFIKIVPNKHRARESKNKRTHIGISVLNSIPK